jgi:hypothetical protein
LFLLNRSSFFLPRKELMFKPVIFDSSFFNFELWDSLICPLSSPTPFDFSPSVPFINPSETKSNYLFLNLIVLTTIWSSYPWILFPSSVSSF